MKIFLGCVDIASMLSGLAEGFKDLGHSVTTVVFEKNKFYPNIEYDIVINKSKNNNENPTPKLLTSLANWLNNRNSQRTLKQNTSAWIAEFDLFIFIWRPWLDEEEIFEEIKRAGKKIICVHSGSDVRHISAYKQQYGEDVKLWEQFFHEEDLNEKIRKIRLHELYADAIFSVPDQEGLAIRPYNHFYIPISKTKKIVYHIPARKVPRLIHAPSRSGIKGTALIIGAIERLKLEGHQFTFELIQNMTNVELIKKIEEADILVDEVLLHGPGVLSAEAMLAGCAVATRTLNDFKNVFNPPVVNINPENIYFELKQLVQNYNYRIELAEKGKQFADLHNNPVNVASTILEKLNNGSADYVPTYYIERYLLPENNTLTDRNKLASAEVAKRYYLESHENIKQAQLRGLL